MNEILVSLLIIAAILVVCGGFFKAVILNWLSRDAELRALQDAPPETTSPSGH